jgi:hypothetical protein
MNLTPLPLAVTVLLQHISLHPPSTRPPHTLHTSIGHMITFGRYMPFRLAAIEGSGGEQRGRQRVKSLDRRYPIFFVSFCGLNIRVTLHGFLNFSTAIDVQACLAESKTSIPLQSHTNFRLYSDNHWQLFMDKGHKLAIKLCTLYCVLTKNTATIWHADVLTQFNSLLFTCPVSSYKTNYRHSTV